MDNSEITWIECINDTIKHYEMLQKRYKKQHNEKCCGHITVALMALYQYQQENE